MKRLVITLVVVLLGLTFLCSSVGPALGQIQVPPPFVWQVFSQGYANVKHSVIDHPGGLYGGQMYVSEMGGVVDQVTPAGVKWLFSPPAGGPLYGAPVGIDIDFTGMYGGNLFVSETVTGNLFRVLPNGVPMIFCAGLNGTGGIAFDPMMGILPYGGLLYCAQWAGGPGPMGNSIMTVNPGGVSAVFTPPGMLADPRYLAFDTSPGFLYGGFLYASEFANGNITPIGPNGMPLVPIANCAAGIEGMAFGLGDPWFGPHMYAANLNTGQVFMVMPGGPAVVWAVSQTGAAYIQFVPAGHPYAWNNLPTMYLDDGNNTIYRIGPNPATPVTPTTWSDVKTMF